MLTWLWDELSSDEDRFYVSYDYDYATMSSHLLGGPTPVPEQAGLAVYSARRYSAKRVRRYGSLSTASSTRVIHERLIPVLAQAVPKNEHQLYPVTVIASGGERINEYFAVIPLNEVTCTDIERSEITSWLAPQFVGKVATNYKSLAHRKGCLCNLSFARDSITGLMVVSEKFKVTMEASKEPGMCFRRPEDMQTWMY